MEILCYWHREVEGQDRGRQGSTSSCRVIEGEEEEEEEKHDILGIKILFTFLTTVLPVIAAS